MTAVVGEVKVVGMPISVKIKIAVVVLVAGGVFWVIGWPIAQPLEPGGALTLVGHHQP